MRTGHKIILWMLWVVPYLLAAGFWWQHVVRGEVGNMLDMGGSARWSAIGSLLGLWAATAALVQLVLIGRVKWIETTFGLDRLTASHRYNAIAMLVFLVGHVALVTYGHSLNDLIASSWLAQCKEFLLEWEDLPAAAIATALLLIVGISSVAWLRRRLPYELWYATHLVVYLAIALAFGHQFEYGIGLTSDVADKTFLWYWYGLYAFCIGNLVVYRVVIPLVRSGRRGFTVQRIESETPDVTSVYIAGRNLATLPARGGQFVLVRFLAPGFRWQSHPFSLSRPPNGEDLRLSIKHVGNYTAAIGELKSGTRVLIDGPHGIFTSERAKCSKVLLIAGGIGITPIRSVAEDLSEAGKDVLLLYGNRDEASIVFRKELDDLQAKYPNFRIVHVLSKAATDGAWTGPCGHIDEEKLRQLVPDVAERDVFLCGPPVMMGALRRTLRALGVCRGRLHYERFGL
jgi:predicted ferric reductase